MAQENNLFSNNKILIIDDNADIHKDFDTILCRENTAEDIDKLEEELFGEKSKKIEFNYELHHAMQGKDGLEIIEQSIKDNSPFSVAFVDMRMPPGWDGLETIEHLWKADPKLQVIICTAYSDYSWEEVNNKLGKHNNLLILKKPFDSAEVAQLACAMTEKWISEQMILSNIEKLEEMDSIKSNMISLLTHEVRTPLTGIIPAADILAKKGGLNEKQSELVDMIRLCAERLNKLFDKVVLLNDLRYGDKTVNSKPHNLAETVRDTISKMEGKASEKNIDIEEDFQQCPDVCYDAALVKKAVSSVIENAIRFSPSGAKINVKIFKDDNYCSLSITNEGSEIEPENIKYVFEEFYDSDIDHHSEGHRLSMAIAHQIMVLHNGSISAESIKEKETSITMQLPMKALETIEA